MQEGLVLDHPGNLQAVRAELDLMAHYGQVWSVACLQRQRGLGGGAGSLESKRFVDSTWPW